MLSYLRRRAGSSARADVIATQQENEKRERLLKQAAEKIDHLWIEIADVADAVQFVSEKIEEQNKLFQEIQSRMEHINQEGSGALDTVAEFKTKVQSVSSDVSHSQTKLKGSLDKVAELTERVSHNKESLSGLSNSLEDVSKVAGDINAVASQTNLLALNASIEAARAGEAGRGFAVVADEVKQLANQTSEATSEIDQTLNGLTDQIETVMKQSESTQSAAVHVSEGTDHMVSFVNDIDQVMATVDQGAQTIESAFGQIQHDTEDTGKDIAMLAAGVAESNNQLLHSKSKISTLLRFTEQLITLTAELEVETADTPFIEDAQARAARISETFEEGIQAGLTSELDLFDRNYQKIAGTDPEQYDTKAIRFYQSYIQPIIEEAKQIGSNLVACTITDSACYQPLNLSAFSQPQKPGDVAHNTKYCRNKKMLVDPVSQNCASNLKPFLLQTYRAPMGNGEYLYLKDVSSPIHVNGRHWGCIRVVYKI